MSVVDGYSGAKKNDDLPAVENLPITRWGMRSCYREVWRILRFVYIEDEYDLSEGYPFRFPSIKSDTSHPLGLRDDLQCNVITHADLGQKTESFLFSGS